jgi:hypothetical protein
MPSVPRAPSPSSYALVKDKHKCVQVWPMCQTSRHFLASAGLFYFHPVVLFSNTIMSRVVGQSNPPPICSPHTRRWEPALYYSLLKSFIYFWTPVNSDSYSASVFQLITRIFLHLSILPQHFITHKASTLIIMSKAQITVFSGVTGCQP